MILPYFHFISYYSEIIVYTVNNYAGTAHCTHEEAGLAKHVHLGGCLSGVCPRAASSTIEQRRRVQLGVWDSMLNPIYLLLL